MKLSSLVPGDLVRNGGVEGVFVVQTQHPFWPWLQLAVWRVEDRWSHDALLTDQDVGELVPSTDAERKARLTKIFLGR